MFPISTPGPWNPTLPHLKTLPHRSSEPPAVPRIPTSPRLETPGLPRLETPRQILRPKVLSLVGFQTPLTKMSWTTPHWYPKYKIPTIRFVVVEDLFKLQNSGL